MIFYHKRHKDYFNYDTKTKKYYYLYNKLVGGTAWDWEQHVKSGIILNLTPDLIGSWQDD